MQKLVNLSKTRLRLATTLKIEVEQGCSVMLIDRNFYRLIGSDNKDFALFLKLPQTLALLVIANITCTKRLKIVRVIVIKM